MKTKIDMEFTMNCSPKVVFPRLSTAGGLSEWFADDVFVKGKIYTFVWEGIEQKAEMVLKKENRYVRFQWIDCPDGEGCFFEFKISQDELTGDLALHITDFAEEDERNDTIELWDTQVAKLKHIMGL
jgi:hypothetical protein